MKILCCPVTALFLLSLVPDQGAKGQIIPVPDTQPPIFLSHYNYPLSTVLLNYVYLSPVQCPVSAGQKLSNTSVTVPRGGSILNAMEIEANYNILASFQCRYLSGLGYFLEKLNNVPSDNEDPLCRWTWSSDPTLFPPGTVDFSVSSVFIPLLQVHNPEITFVYQHFSGGNLPFLRRKPRLLQEETPPSNNVLPPLNMTVDYLLVGTIQCPLPPNLSIPSTPYTVSIQAGGSALNVMERAADLDPFLEFTVSSTFGIWYFPKTIAGVSEVAGCIWCLTYKPPNSSDIIIPESDLQNFVIPVPETTLRMEYTPNCQSAFQVAVARKNMIYFREKGIIKSPTSEEGAPVEKECCCGGEKCAYNTTYLILGGVLFLSSLFLCTRYFR